MVDGQRVRKTSITISSVKAPDPSILSPASKDITSAFMLLCDTKVCCLHVHESRKKFWLPKMHNTSPGIDLESVKSPAKSASWNRFNLQSLAFWPT